MAVGGRLVHCRWLAPTLTGGLCALVRPGGGPVDHPSSMSFGDWRVGILPWDLLGLSMKQRGISWDFYRTKCDTILVPIYYIIYDYIIWLIMSYCILLYYILCHSVFYFSYYTYIYIYILYCIVLYYILFYCYVLY